MRRRTILLLTAMMGALVLSSGVALAASQLDQQNASAPTSTVLTSDHAQTFTTGLTGTLDKVSVYLTSAPTGDLTARIYPTDSEGKPVISITPDNTLSYGKVTAPSTGWVDISLEARAPVEANTKYALVLFDPSQSARWGYDSHHYSRGNLASWSLAGPTPEGWVLDSSADFLFKTYVNDDDLTAPTFIGTPTGKKVSPRANAIATFSEAMNETSVEAPGTFTLKKGTTTVAATVSYDVDNHRAILDPTRKLKAGATYTATVTSGAEDEAGNAVVVGSWSFKVRR